MTESLSQRRTSIVEGLLVEIYDRWHHRYRGVESSIDSDTITEASTDHRHPRPRLHVGLLRNKDIGQLRDLIRDQEEKVASMSTRLVRQLVRRDQRLVRLQKHFDIITAILQASSLKRQQDTRLKFTIEPKNGQDSFQEWKDAIKAVARLPLGIPTDLRKKVWLTLANQYIAEQRFDWDRVHRFAFNDHSNPDDDKLGLQIVKDLHRTGCDQFCSEADRAVLKRVLLAYARWNKRVGYCQGLNVITALILEVVERNEDAALKILVYLIDHVLTDSYFAESLQAFSVDMAVFRHLLRQHLPALALHLESLQRKAMHAEEIVGRGYEPPLTNVFTMQWFLTLFATCLPPDTVLHVWDSLLLEGSEVILRTGIAIWEHLADRIRKVSSVDQFYTTMGQLTHAMSERGTVSSGDLMARVYSLAPFPMPGLADLRERFTYNITPFSECAALLTNGGNSGGETGEEDWEEEEEVQGTRGSGPGCFSAFLGGGGTGGRLPAKAIELEVDGSLSHVGPGAVSTSPSLPAHRGSHCEERMSTNLRALAAQYDRLRDRQSRASLVLSMDSSADRPPPPINHLTMQYHAGDGGKKGRLQRQERLESEHRVPLPCVKTLPEPKSRRSRPPPLTLPHGRSLTTSSDTTLTPSSMPSTPLHTRRHSNRRPGRRGRSQPSSLFSLSPEDTKDFQPLTLLQLASGTANTNSKMSHTLSQDEVDTHEDAPPPPPSLEELLARHHDRVTQPAMTTSSGLNDTERWVSHALTHLQRNQGPSQLPPIESLAKYSVEDSSQSSSGSDEIQEKIESAAPSTVGSNSKPRVKPPHHLPITAHLMTSSRIRFGSQFGLYKALTGSLEARSTIDASVRRSYMTRVGRSIQSMPE